MSAQKKSSAAKSIQTIDSIRVQKFGAIGEASLDFGPGLNILVGANESGKSTFLRALRAVLSLPATAHARLRENEYAGEVEIEFRAGKELLGLRKRFAKSRHAEAELWQRNEHGRILLADGDDVDKEIRRLLPLTASKASSKKATDDYFRDLLFAGQEDPQRILASGISEGSSAEEHLRNQLCDGLLPGRLRAMLKFAESEIKKAFTPTGKRRGGTRSISAELDPRIEALGNELGEWDLKFARREELDKLLKSSKMELIEIEKTIAEQTKAIELSEKRESLSKQLCELKTDIIRNEENSQELKSLQEDVAELNAQLRQSAQGISSAQARDAIKKHEERRALVEEIKTSEKKLEKDNARLLELRSELSLLAKLSLFKEWQKSIADSENSASQKNELSAKEKELAKFQKEVEELNSSIGDAFGNFPSIQVRASGDILVEQDGLDTELSAEQCIDIDLRNIKLKVGGITISLAGNGDAPNSDDPRFAELAQKRRSVERLEDELDSLRQGLEASEAANQRAKELEKHFDISERKRLKILEDKGQQAETEKLETEVSSIRDVILQAKTKESSLDGELRSLPPETELKTIADSNSGVTLSADQITERLERKTEELNKILASGVKSDFSEEKKLQDQLQKDLESMPKPSEHFSTSLEQNRARREELKESIARVDTELSLQAGEQNNESVDAKRQELSELKKNRDMLYLDADAWLAIRDAIFIVRDEMSRELGDILKAPLEKRANRLFGSQTKIQLDAGLRLLNLGRSHSSERDSLSLGAQQLLALALRLTLAEETNFPLVLDDPLTHVDAERMLRVREELMTISRRHQLIMTTCHPKTYFDEEAEEGSKLGGLFRWISAKKHIELSG